MKILSILLVSGLVFAGATRTLYNNIGVNEVAVTGRIAGYLAKIK